MSDRNPYSIKLKTKVMSENPPLANWKRKEKTISSNVLTSYPSAIMLSDVVT